MGNTDKPKASGGSPVGPHAGRKAGPPKGFARRLILARMARGLSQRDAAAEIGVSRNTVCQWEIAEAEPRRLQRQAADAWIARALKDGEEILRRMKAAGVFRKHGWR